jgi:hypothetical protein
LCPGAPLSNDIEVRNQLIEKSKRSQNARQS